MALPLTFTIGLHRFYQGADDGYGNPIAPNFDPPIDQPGTVYKVLGWSGLTSAVSAGEIVAERHRVTEERELYAPDAIGINPYDRVDLDDGQYEVVGFPTDHTRGPWWNPRMKTYALQKVLG